MIYYCWYRDGELREGFPVALFKLPRCVPPKISRSSPSMLRDPSAATLCCHSLACLPRS